MKDQNYHRQSWLASQGSKAAQEYMAQNAPAQEDRKFWAYKLAGGTAFSKESKRK